MKHFSINCLKMLFLSCVFLWTHNAAAQELNFVKGVRQGVVKVKFSPEMTKTLSEIKISTRNNQLSTGIQSFDIVSRSVQATNMERLITYSPKFEDRIREHGLHLWYVVHIPEGVNPEVAVQEFKKSSVVENAELEYQKIIGPYTVKPYTPSVRPYSTLPFNDPRLKDQWHYQNTGQTGYEGGADINLFKAWEITAGKSNVIVSVHDEGVDVMHEDLHANVWVNEIEKNGTPGVDDDGNGLIDDIYGYNFDKRSGTINPQTHGTHVAGTIAAVNNNGKGVSGVAGGTGNGDGVKIMSLQCMGGGAIENTFVYAANMGAVISQNSWGYPDIGFFEESVQKSIEYFIKNAGNYEGSPMKGGIVIFAAGNDGLDDEFYPGYWDETLSIGALDVTWKKASYSNYGTWVDISAPGGDNDHGAGNEILSTLPYDNYGYLSGTSMACPHVSGIAALILSNSDRQMTNKELWDILYTSVKNVDDKDPEYAGKLGSGAIDAYLALQKDNKKAPEKTIFEVAGTAQDFALLKWNIPADEDDSKPTWIDIFYSREPITAENISKATTVRLENKLDAGSEMQYQIDNLLSLTTYYFAIKTVDRWGNESVLSEVLSATTNDGPTIDVDENSKDINITTNTTVSKTVTHPITVLNNSEGLLRWEYLVRNTEQPMLSYSAKSIKYPKAKISSSKDKLNIQSKVSSYAKNGAVTRAFQAKDIHYAYLANTQIIGEEDLSYTNSAASKFVVTYEDGFNLTDITFLGKYNIKNGPLVFEVYKGEELPVRQNLIYAQEYDENGTGDEDYEMYIHLNEQINFEKGEIFWLVVHVPANNQYPLAMGYEIEPEYSDNCYYSIDMGSNWVLLEKILSGDNRFAWYLHPSSKTEHISKYVTLDPSKGEVTGNSSAAVTLTADGSKLINGTYKSNLIFTTNDDNNKLFRLPVTFNVEGQQPKMTFESLVDYGSVLDGSEKIIDIVLTNEGFGNFSGSDWMPLSYELTNPEFSIVGWFPNSISARQQTTVQVKFKPTVIGNRSGLLKFGNDDYSYQISLTGVGTASPVMELEPESVTINDVEINSGDKTASFTIKNTGEYPLKWFIPKYDDKGISNNWDFKYHKYGYKIRTSEDILEPLVYQFQDISTTGTDITSHYIVDSNWYYELDMGFEFPYYGNSMKKLYISKDGFTTFDNSKNPLNTPKLNDPESSPFGYISPIGFQAKYENQGKVLYQVEPDRVIVQYDNMTDGWLESGTVTAQMVLFYNGDIRFYYKSLPTSEYELSMLNILIEDLDQEDGILIHEWESKDPNLKNNYVLGFDYPGPNIIKSIDNGSGVIPPGETTTINVVLSTESLHRGEIKRYISFINNNPVVPQFMGLITLDVNKGGKAEPVVSVDSVDFKTVFTATTVSKAFTIKNAGSDFLNITSIVSKNGKFNITGDVPGTINPKLYKKYEIVVPTESVTSLEDDIVITYSDGTTYTIYAEANIALPPAIGVDLSEINETLDYGTFKSIDFNVTNTGTYDMIFNATGEEWLRYNVKNAEPLKDEITYTFKKYNDGNSYQWIDIKKTGIKFPYYDFEPDKNKYWNTVELPFEFEFYGEKYSQIKVGPNGIVSVGQDPPILAADIGYPIQSDAGFITPLWVLGDYDFTNFDPSEGGSYIQAFKDKIVISWEYLMTLTGMGNAMSAQMIIYKDGVMKFQYKTFGDDGTSKFVTVGLQKPDKSDIVYISDKMEFEHGDGLAIVVTPVKKYKVSPGSKLEGEIVLNAENTSGGEYDNSLKIETNVPGKESLEKPVKLTINGKASAALPDYFDLGRYEFKVDAYGNPYSYSKEFKLANNGVAPLEISWMKFDKNDEIIDVQLFLNNFMGWQSIKWMYNEDFPEEAPVKKILPGKELSFRMIFNPQQAGDFTEQLIMTTNIDEQRLNIKATSFDPPSLGVDQEPINIHLNMTTDTKQESRDFDNVEGKSELNYEISLKYDRILTPETATNSAKTYNTSDTASLSKVVEAEAATNKLRNTRISDFNRTIKYSDEETTSNFLGFIDNSSFVVASKFNSGTKSFNMSHVITFFRANQVFTGTLKTEVRVGANLDESVVIATGSLEYDATVNNKGDWFEIPLDKTAEIYPNEDFWVVIINPEGTDAPQGYFYLSSLMKETFYFRQGRQWLDVLTSAGPLGWLIYVGEQTEKEIGWMKLTSEDKGTLQIGDASKVSIEVSGTQAVRGDQTSYVVFRSNDTNKPEVTVPVILHVNEAPKFNNAPQGLLVKENETKVVTIPVSDAENNTFNLVAVNTDNIMSYTFVDNVLELTFAPAYGDIGNYEYVFKATDEYGAVSELNIQLEVAKNNRAPIFKGLESITYEVLNVINEYDINDFFEDPDNDSFTYTVRSENTNIITVFSSDDQFGVKAKLEGETNIILTATDSFGGETSKAIKVIVKSGSSISESSVGDLSVYPNPVKNVTKVFLSEEWRKNISIEVYDASGRLHLNKGYENTNDSYIEVDLTSLASGIYQLKVKSNDKQEVVKIVKE